MLKVKYNHKQTKDGLTARARSFAVAQSVMGKDYQQWFKDKAKLQKVLKFCHETVYGMPTPYVKDKGLQLQFDYLYQCERQSRSTKAKRQCYREVADDALAIGLVNQTQHKKMVS